MGAPPHYHRLQEHLHCRAHLCQRQELHCNQWAPSSKDGKWIDTVNCSCKAALGRSGPQWPNSGGNAPPTSPSWRLDSREIGDGVACIGCGAWRCVHPQCPTRLPSILVQPVFAMQKQKKRAQMSSHTSQTCNTIEMSCERLEPMPKGQSWSYRLGPHVQGHLRLPPASL